MQREEPSSPHSHPQRSLRPLRQRLNVTGRQAIRAVIAFPKAITEPPEQAGVAASPNVTIPIFEQGVDSPGWPSRSLCAANKLFVDPRKYSLQEYGNPQLAMRVLEHCSDVLFG